VNIFNIHQFFIWERFPLLRGFGEEFDHFDALHNFFLYKCLNPG
jgi:hypothetical protein